MQLAADRTIHYKAFQTANADNRVCVCGVGWGDGGGWRGKVGMARAIGKKG